LPTLEWTMPTNWMILVGILSRKAARWFKNQNH
jgi:hypothetical protein